MRILDIINAALALHGETDSDATSIARAAVNFWTGELWDMFAWRDTQLLAYTTVAAAQNILILPRTFAHVMGIKINDVFLTADQANLFMYTDPTIYERAGTPVHYIPMRRSAIYGTPSGQALVITCSNALDYGKIVVIRGDVGGQEKEDTIVLAAGPQTTANLYDNVYGLTKGPTIGTVTATAGAINMVTLDPAETNRQHIRLLLLEAPSSTMNVLVHGKMHRKEVYADDDSSPLPSLNNCLTYHAWATLLESDMRQAQRGAAKRQEAIQLMKTQLDAETNQALNSTRFVPGPTNAMCDMGPALYRL